MTKERVDLKVMIKDDQDIFNQLTQEANMLKRKVEQAEVDRLTLLNEY
jgi:hypothetical protein